MAKILSLFDHKGGVGKTTTAASLGGILATKFGKKVLLVDIDAQKNLTQSFFNEDEHKFEKTVFDLFDILETHRLPGSLPIVNIRENLDIIPSSDQVCKLDIMYGACPGREAVLRKALGLVRDSYDWIILDSPAQIGIATTNALTAADYVVIPVNCDGYSIGGLRQTLQLVEGVQFATNENLQIAGYLKTRFNRKRVADQMVENQISEEFGEKVFKTSIRECAELTKANLFHYDIYKWNENCNASIDYIAFAEEIIERTK